MTKILLVEDNELNRDMLGRRLKRRGYEVVIAADGQEGVAKAQSASPDLVLMDMSLPVMDGWTATSELKKDPRTATIPVIALTAHAMVGDRDKALSAGCDDYDTKPVDIKRLLGKMEVLLENASASPSSESVQSTPAPSTAPPIAEKPPASPSSEPVQSTPVSPTAPPIAEKPSAPSTPVPPQVPLTASLPSPSNKATGKILVVDDIEENRDMLSRRLFRKDYETVLAESGEEALELLNTHQISLVLLDIMMPGIGGIETLRQIRQRYSRLELPVIMVTAKDQSEDVVQAFNLGANDYVTKPVDLSILLVRIQAQLQTVNLSHSYSAAPVTQPIPESADAPKEPEIVERYRPIKILSRTPISQTYTAQDLENSEEPLKLVQKICLQIQDPKVLDIAKKLFATEVKILETVKRHDSISLPIDSFEKNGEFYLISEYVEGSLFSIEAAKIPPGDTRQVVRMTEEILRLVEPLHYGCVTHYRLNPSCFMLPKHRDGKLVLIDTGLQNRFILKLSEIFPVEKFLPADNESRQLMSALSTEAGYQVDISAIGMIAMQVLTGKSESYALEILRFNEEKWSIFDSLKNHALVDFFKRMLCQKSSQPYTSISDANRDILKLWFDLNYKDKVSDIS